MSEDRDRKNGSLLEQARRLARRALSAAAERIGVGLGEPPTGERPAQGASGTPWASAAGPTEGPPPTPLTPSATSPRMPPRPEQLPAPSPAMKGPSVPQEPFGILDFEEPPETYGVDEVTVLARDPYTLFAYWEVTGAGRDAARARLGSDGALVLRIYSVTASPEGATTTDTHDIHLDWEHGRRYFGAPRSGAHVAAAVGLVGPDGAFAPIALAPRIRVPFAEAGPEAPVEWMEVSAPVRRPQHKPEPPRIVARGPERVVAGAPRGRVPGRIPAWREGAWEHRPGSHVPPRAGEVWAEGPPRWEEMPSSPWRWLPGSWPTSGTWPPGGGSSAGAAPARGEGAKEGPAEEGAEDAEGGAATDSTEKR